MDMFTTIIPKPQLCIWRLLAQGDISLAHACKVMFKLLCQENVLEINVGRYKNIPKGLRMCPLCESGEGDENHFFWSCSAFLDRFIKLCP